MSEPTGTEEYYRQRALQYDRVYPKPERQGDLQLMQEWLAALLAGRRVIEVAAGTGYWTDVIAGSVLSDPPPLALPELTTPPAPRCPATPPRHHHLVMTTGRPFPLGLARHGREPSWGWSPEGDRGDKRGDQERLVHQT